MTAAAQPVLSITDLQLEFTGRAGPVAALGGINLSVARREIVGIVGESGSGKSVTALSVMGLLPRGKAHITAGEIRFNDQNLLNQAEPALRRLRGRDMTMIFQEPMTALNPVFTIGSQIADVFMTHQEISKKEALQKAIHLLDLVKIPSPETRVHSYPHQLSGGMRQRAMIAMALASPTPGLMIADEPTTALDVTIQAQILDLLVDLKDKINMSILLITHDMGVVAETADRVAVMYAGRKVEEADVFSIFEKPSHPYTVGLLNSLPSNTKYRGSARLEAIPGTVPDLLTIGEGCPFFNRCNYASDECRVSFPTETVLDPEHSVWCHNHQKLSKGSSEQ